MPERIPQSVARRVALKAYLSSDHISPATGVTLAVVISKNGASFGNPSAGATNATEIGLGWYYVDLSTTDTGTGGPLLVRGTSATSDPSEDRFFVADAHNAGFDGVPSATAAASGGLLTFGSSTGQINPTGGKVNTATCDTLTTYTGNTPQTGDSFARIGTAGVGLTNLGDTRIANLDATVSSRTKPADTQAAVTLVTTTTNLTNAPTSGDFTATMKASLNAATPAVTVSDKTGFSLSAAGVQAIWDALTSALTAVGSVGKKLADWVIGTPQTGDSYARLGAPAGASVSADVAAIEANAVAIKAKTDNLPAAPAAVSDIPTANQNADAYLDRADAIETGVTPRQSDRLMLAAAAGKLSGAATTTVTIRNAAADDKNRIVATVDSDGNRTAVTLNTT